MSDLQRQGVIFKFGKKDNLEDLKSGNLYFSPVDKYRNDGTYFRGDRNEGCVPLDPSSVHVNGQYISNYLASATMVYESEKGLYMFCAASLTESIYMPYDGKPNLKSDFKKAIRPFGDYVFVVNRTELVKRICEAKDKHPEKLGVMWDNITYRDLNSYSIELRELYNRSGTKLDRFFVKSNEYEHQNEWRIIIYGLETALLPNNNEAFSINVGAFENCLIFQSDEFLDTLEVSF